MTLRDDANKIIEASIQAVLPDEAVKKALSSASFLQNRTGNIYMVSCGKGKGGRNQELALAAAEGISGLGQTAVLLIKKAE